MNAEKKQLNDADDKNNDDGTNITKILVQIGVFLGSAKVGEFVLENRTLEPIVNYIQQFAVEIAKEISPMLAISVAGPVGDHLSNVIGAGATFFIVGYTGLTAVNY